MNEVNEGIANIACVIVIDWQIKKVKFDFEILVKFLQ
jgi:hypothetical protein